MLDLGLEPFLITATLEGIVAQRLVRKICVNCKTEYQPTEEMLMELELTSEQVGGKKFFYGKGCDQCNNTGYRGRTGIYEIMTFNDELRDLVMNHASTAVLREASKRAGMKTLRENGLLAIYDGVTTIDEVARETIAAQEE
jgi:type IV pilus assembly protein PilB